MKKVLSIAGSDSCAGAGIQADMKTISALGAYALTVITAVTAQNTQGVTAIQEIDTRIVRAQLQAIFDDIKVDAVKIGMLSSIELIEEVTGALLLYAKNIPIVLDPVMVAKSGDRLLKIEAINSLKKNLFPLATIITPNLPETEELLEREIKGVKEMEEAAKELREITSAWVVVKGGHLGGEPLDVLAGPEGIFHLNGTRIRSQNNHGTGCTFAAAIATYLSQEHSVQESVSKAKIYVHKSLEKGFPIGKGVGVLDHFNT